MREPERGGGAYLDDFIKIPVGKVAGLGWRRRLNVRLDAGALLNATKKINILNGNRTKVHLQCDKIVQFTSTLVRLRLNRVVSTKPLECYHARG